MKMHNFAEQQSLAHKYFKYAERFILLFLYTNEEEYMIDKREKKNKNY